MERTISYDDSNLTQVPRLLAEGKVVILKRVKGISMLPFIRGGVDSVKLRKVEGLKVGNIVLAIFNGRPLVHRVIAIEGNRVTLMGDGNLEGTEHRLLPVRKYLLKVYKKWNKLFVK